jgi:hypothetical protein
MSVIARWRFSIAARRLPVVAGVMRAVRLVGSFEGISSSGGLD